MSEELKKCPFCGSKAVTHIWYKKAERSTDTIAFTIRERKAVGVIAWNRKAANFDIVKGTYRLDFHYPVFEEIEVIGNIYDNPELLK